VTASTLVAPPPRLFHDEATLDELLVALWEGLQADRSVACPVCGAEMAPQYGAHARAIGGRCSDCGAGLE
jgi:DNA-directed RNA polymerase subunit RPC12/RpoP